MTVLGHAGRDLEKTEQEGDSEEKRLLGKQGLSDPGEEPAAHPEESGLCSSHWGEETAEEL